jgi:DNA-binding transcriptional ArsR family regulator
MHFHAMNVRTHRPRRLLACVGNTSRWKVVSALAEGERCVTELALHIRLSQSCTTRHLQALVREGVVRRTREGKRVVFALRNEDPMVRELLTWALPEAAPRVAVAAAGGSKTREKPAARASREVRPVGSRRPPVPQEGSPQEDTVGPRGPDGSGGTGGRTRAEPAVDESSGGAGPVRNPEPDDMEDWLL